MNVNCNSQYFKERAVSSMRQARVWRDKLRTLESRILLFTYRDHYDATELRSRAKILRLNLEHAVSDARADHRRAVWWSK